MAPGRGRRWPPGWTLGCLYILILHLGLLPCEALRFKIAANTSEGELGMDRRIGSEGLDSSLSSAEGSPTGSNKILGMLSGGSFVVFRLMGTNTPTLTASLSCLDPNTGENMCAFNIKSWKGGMYRLYKNGNDNPLQLICSDPSVDPNPEQELFYELTVFEKTSEVPDCPGNSCNFKIKPVKGSPEKVEANGVEFTQDFYNIYAADGIHPLLVQNPGKGRGAPQAEQTPQIYYGEYTNTVCDMNFCDFAIAPYNTVLTKWKPPTNVTV